jgi:hypothetical protein
MPIVELTITNTNGESFCYSGALIEDATEDESLSNLIRTTWIIRAVAL